MNSLYELCLLFCCAEIFKIFLTYFGIIYSLLIYIYIFMTIYLLLIPGQSLYTLCQVSYLKLKALIIS